jgi:hypothetical protein
MQDIDRTIKALKLNREPHHIRFIMGYLACEKAAAIMQAMHAGEPSRILDRPYSVKSGKIIRACRHLGFEVSDATIHAIFDDHPKQSARTIRNKFFHDMGPTHLDELRRPDLIKLMGEFLGCIEAVQDWIAKNGTP